MCPAAPVVGTLMKEMRVWPGCKTVLVKSEGRWTDRCDNKKKKRASGTREHLWERRVTPLEGLLRSRYSRTVLLCFTVHTASTVLNLGWIHQHFSLYHLLRKNVLQVFHLSKMVALNSIWGPFRNGSQSYILQSIKAKTIFLQPDPSWPNGLSPPSIYDLQNPWSLGIVISAWLCDPQLPSPTPQSS